MRGHTRSCFNILIRINVLYQRPAVKR